MEGMRCAGGGGVVEINAAAPWVECRHHILCRVVVMVCIAVVVVELLLSFVALLFGTGRYTVNPIHTVEESLFVACRTSNDLKGAIFYELQIQRVDNFRRCH